MAAVRLSPIPVPFVDNAIKVVDVRWLSTSGTTIRVLSRRTGQACLVEFAAVDGVRVLHELDLASLWSGQSREVMKSSWLFEVQAGGWLELESTRADFCSRHDPGIREFLLVGYQECVSVLSNDLPKLSAG